MSPARLFAARMQGRAQTIQIALSRRWQALSMRERKGMVLVAAVLGVAFTWSVLIDPAMRSLARAEVDIPRLQAQRAELDALVREAQTLGGRAQSALPASAQQEGLAASLAAAGLSSAVVATQDDEGRWQLAISDVPAPVLMQWLADIVEPIRLRPTALDLSRVTDAGGRPVPGRVRGTVQLADIADPEATR
ncbi:type II secretion system protein GspM [Pigmentiphaga aceris]|nr:type II secretion system protein GspM [Pigmentiphaga aceris]